MRCVVWKEEWCDEDAAEDESDPTNRAAPTGNGLEGVAVGGDESKVARRGYGRRGGGVARRAARDEHREIIQLECKRPPRRYGELDGQLVTVVALRIGIEIPRLILI